MKQKQKIAPWG